METSPLLYGVQIGFFLQLARPDLESVRQGITVPRP